MSPKVLFIDDQYGAAVDGDNLDRRDYCHPRGIQDVTGDIEAEIVSDAMCDAIWCSGQRVTEGVTENDLDGVLAVVREGWRSYPRWALVFVDLHFRTGNLAAHPEGRDADRDPSRFFGWQILAALQNDPGLKRIPVVMLSGMDMEGDDAQKKISAGAKAFVDKSKLTREKLDSLLVRYGLVEDEALIGRAPAFLQVLQRTRQWSQDDIDVLVTGQTGTGKELLAHYAHRYSRRAEKPFVTVNCAAIAPTLLDSELFGYVKGAFTGATQDRKGYFETAAEGTVFLDEVGDLTPDAQGRFLRVLANKEVSPVGGAETRRVDVRVISATNRDLECMVAKGTFREDLYQRLKGHDLHLPKLRERQDDIPVLAEHFLRRISSHTGRRKELGEDAVPILIRYGWPRNVRELEGVLARAAGATEGAFVRAANLVDLVPIGQRDGQVVKPQEQAAGMQSPTPPAQTVDGVDELVALLEEFDTSGGSKEDLFGCVPTLQAAYARLIARLVIRSFQIEKEDPVRGSDELPKQTQPARTLLGLPHGTKLTADAARKKVRALLKLDIDALRTLEENEPVLGELLDRFVR